MVTVLVVKTGLCVASGIFPASALAAGGSLVPPAGELVELTLGASAARTTTASIISEIQKVFFMGGFIGLCHGRMLLSARGRKSETSTPPAAKTISEFRSCFYQVLIKRLCSPSPRPSPPGEGE